LPKGGKAGSLQFCSLPVWLYILNSLGDALFVTVSIRAKQEINHYSLIFIGILISYLPQHIRIISLRSSFGISPYFVLLGTTSGTSAFANILVLPRSTRDVACCKEISGLACFAGLLGILQAAAQWSCFIVV
jgi:PQ loop repeat protein